MASFLNITLTLWVAAFFVMLINILFERWISINNKHLKKVQRHIFFWKKEKKTFKTKYFEV